MKKKKRRADTPQMSNGLCGTDRFWFPEKRIKTYFEKNGTMHRDEFYSDADPDGMYTGVPRDMFDKPVQDADDL